MRQLTVRSFNKGVLAFMRRSVIQNSRTPDHNGTLHFIWTRQASHWNGMSEEDGAYWGATIGNTFLADLERRPKDIDSWGDFKDQLLPHAIEDEWHKMLKDVEEWDAQAVGQLGKIWQRRQGDFGTTANLRDSLVREAP